MKHIPAFILILLLSYFFSSCTESSPALNSSEVLSISTHVPAATETATETTTATETKTQTPTEIPLFTEAQVEAASPFDDSTWPDIFKTTQEHPEKATEQQWQDEYQFILAVREKAGIPTTIESKNYNPQLQSLSNALTWEQNHPDEVKAGKRVAIAPVEYRAMIEEQRKIGGIPKETPKSIQNWKSDLIGPILGQEINSGRHPFDKVSGKLAGFGTIGGENVLLIDIEDTDGYHILFPVVVYVGTGPKLPKGSKCLVLDTNYSNKHNGNSSYILPKDEELSPLTENVTGKIVSWEDLYAGLGKMIIIQGGGYMGELQNKTGVPNVYGFSPELNLEMAYIVEYPPQ